MRASRSARTGAATGPERPRPAKRPAARKRSPGGKSEAERRPARVAQPRSDVPKHGVRSDAAKLVPAAPAKAAKPAVKIEPMLYRFCKAGWGVLVERLPSQQGTRFVCPFCSQSHRVSGPVRGFRKVGHAQWTKLRWVDE